MTYAGRQSKTCTFSIIIPVLHERELINTALENISHVDSTDTYEVIVVDGSASGDTLAIIRQNNVRSLIAVQGRARQMNAGATIARGEILIFLHADTQLPKDALRLIKQVLEAPQYVGGSFTLGINSQKMAYKIIEVLSWIRCRITQIPYGDQVIFLKKTYFQNIGGYSDIPFLEDVELMQRIKKHDGKIGILSNRVITSPRRWQTKGFFRTSAIYVIITILYFVGVSPVKLKKFYRY